MCYYGLVLLLILLAILCHSPYLQCANGIGICDDQVSCDAHLKKYYYKLSFVDILFTIPRRIDPSIHTPLQRMMYTIHINQLTLLLADVIFTDDGCKCKGILERFCLSSRRSTYAGCATSLKHLALVGTKTCLKGSTFLLRNILLSTYKTQL